MSEVDGDKPQKKRFASYPIGYFDIAEVQTGEGKLRPFVAIDPTSKVAFVPRVESAGKMEAADFLRGLIEAVPYRIHIVPTGNGIQFTARKQEIWDSTPIFDRVCEEHGIEHRLTIASDAKSNAVGSARQARRRPSPRRRGWVRLKLRGSQVNHPWTDGRVEPMNRTIEDATVKRERYDTHEQLRTHWQLFVEASNHARRLKTLPGLTPHEFVCHTWTKEPDRFRINPSHYIPGPYT